MYDGLLFHLPFDPPFAKLLGEMLPDTMRFIDGRRAFIGESARGKLKTQTKVEASRGGALLSFTRGRREPMDSSDI